MIEDFGNVPFSQIDKRKSVTFKTHMWKLPKSRRKNPELRQKHLHDLFKIDSPIEEEISKKTINEHLSYLSFFMIWCKNQRRRINELYQRKSSGEEKM